MVMLHHILIDDANCIILRDLTSTRMSDGSKRTDDDKGLRIVEDRRSFSSGRGWS
jgi:hypothetical protein